MSAAPVRRPSTRAAVNTDDCGSPASGSPSKEYSVAPEAVSTTVPRALSRDSSAASSSPLAPWAKAPLKQQSRITSCWRARQSDMRSISQVASTPVPARRALTVSVAANQSRRRASSRPWQDR
ncbi:hypothetical protein GCM10009687_59750 [Asanoa iriomotensis]|uniref:Uncharacterized protein n=1 Tax=Asanoa iriomotensis TaxID=234613 RepID=A0ABQ4BUG5_9ACTN|nr:hypothetical protein Air01nite_02640 [Asanoa iriomotensis]